MLYWAHIQFSMYDVQRWKNVPSELIFPTGCRLLVASRNGRPVPPRGTPVQPRPAKMVKTTRQCQWKGKIKVTLSNLSNTKSHEGTIWQQKTMILIITSMNGMQIKVSSAVANDFNQLIYAVGAPPCPVLEIKGHSDHSRRTKDILAGPKN